ncbi:MAG: hypothetical protein COT06_09455 [Syntrophobacteraceae bacterium CG07_land_8_20_14_0_80_61_8]|nr:MAG: hypothetical protein COT06_09455 [Syntrophobacteraceae bacterium CG07_land_8_20_14_0_80_61_8]
MSKKSSLKDSRTDWERIHAMSDGDIDTSEIPEITEERMAGANLRVGGRPVSKGKVRISILVDAEVLAYFEAKAGGKDYQTLINEALKANLRDRDLETTLRRIIREELRAAGN